MLIGYSRIKFLKNQQFDLYMDQSNFEVTSTKIKRIAQLVNGQEILSSFSEIILCFKNFNINQFAYKIRLFQFCTNFPIIQFLTV